MKTSQLKAYIFSLLAVLTLPSCLDEIEYDDQTIGEGEALVSATIEYEPNTAVEAGQSRTPGQTIGNIDELAVVVYTPKKELYKIYNNSELSLERSINVQVPEDYVPGTDVAEDTTACVKFTLPEALPFGRYYMYVVANLGKTITPEMAETPETLKGQVVEWNFDDISKNAQMFGYMTADDNRTSAGFDAPLLVVNRQNMPLHSWIKRLASKVTVAFDGKGLHQNIWVFVHKVSIRQIPLTCKLGEPNQPTSSSEVSTDGYDGPGAPDTPGVVAATQYLTYNGDNVVADDQYPSEEDYANWLTVANGTAVKGSKNHTAWDPALFFYENLQGDFADNPNKEWFNKEQNADSVGTVVTPTMPDYKDNVPLGTFIEVEAYYVSNNEKNISNGPIKYRFMLGQNTTYNYDAIRNHHYKVTLGFKGFANQPDWHIEYVEETPDVFANPVYVSYGYNSEEILPLRFKGNLKKITLEIIENNWAPYDDSEPPFYVPEETIGTDNWATRQLQFNWNRSVYVNEGGRESATPDASLDYNSYTSNALYGLHKATYKYLTGPKKGQNYYVTPIWVGFLRLLQPSEYENEGTHMPQSILADDGNWRYDYGDVREAMRKYYLGLGGLTKNGVTWTNNLDLSKRTLEGDELSAGSHGTGRNSYEVERTTIEGENYTILKLKIWTQPKSMGYISGFSGQNPYKDYPRKAVVRITSVFEMRVGEDVSEKTLVNDLDVIQVRQLVNPKGIWRTASSSESFDVHLYESRGADDPNFYALLSKGEWSAYVAEGTGVTLSPLGESRVSQTISGGIEGDTESEVSFKVNFSGGYNCAIVEVNYHGNQCIHRILCRQGYNQPLNIEDNGVKWSSYSVFSCDPNFVFGTQDGTCDAVLTVNPLALGTLYKKGNYREGILISNATKYPVRTQLGNPNSLDLTNGLTGNWLDIVGIARAQRGTGAPQASTTTKTSVTYYNPNTNANATGTFDAATWHWAKFRGTLFTGDKHNYRVPTYEEYFSVHANADIEVGVCYGDGATQPATTSGEAYGFFDPTNTVQRSTNGMRGVFVYNRTNANQVFFPVGTTGMGRRNMQGLPTSPSWQAWAGVLRYSSVYNLLTGAQNNLRPICYNMPSVPGAIYWLYQESGGNPGWDMNYFDLNFTPYDYAMSIGPYGDAVPIKLILDE